MFALVAVVGLLSACNGLGKMQKCIGEVNVEAIPNPLEVRGDKVALSVNAKFPPRFFDKRSRLELVPTMVTKSGDMVFKSYGLQGEKFPGNDKMISFKLGGEYTYTGDLAYSPAMESTDLQLIITGYRGKKMKKFLPIKLGDGVITTPYLLQNSDMALLGKDNFSRVTQHTQEMVINYQVNSSVVLPKEKVDNDVKETQAFLKKVSKNANYAIKSISIEAYASPEGELRKNENLAVDRAASGKSVVMDLFKTAKVKDTGSGFYSLTPKGEDWEGFKSLMENSKIADKDLIIRLLSMHTDKEKREQEIRNLSATFTEVAQEILPKLRRSTVSINYELTGKTDEHILRLATTQPDSLNAEELLYAATLVTDMETKRAIYSAAETQFPSDYRGANNVGCMLLAKGDFAGAKVQFAKAFAISSNEVTTTNMAIVTRREGDRDKAMRMFSGLKATNEVKYNMGIINIQNGDYETAINNMAGFSTFNTALAYTLNKNYDKAEETLKKSADRETAMGNYLDAIIAARTNRTEVMIEKLTAASKADESLRQKAAIDAEFIRYRENAAFKALVK